MKILCPTDFSDTAHNATAYAAKLAQALGAHLTLFYVQSLRQLVPEEALVAQSMITSEIGEQLDAQSLEISTVFRISCDAEVETTAKSISRAISNHTTAYDLIVMGTNGTTDLHDLMAGSHTYQVAMRSKIPLILVPEAHTYSPIHRVIYAFNYLKEHDLPLKQLATWAGPLGAEVTVLQVVEGHFDGLSQSDVMLEQDRLRAEHPDISLTFDTVWSADVIGTMNTYMLRNDPDALALCLIHKGLIDRLFHKSVAKAITGIASYPMFIFHQ